MEHQSEKILYQPNRLGFHYFQDADHYGQKHIKQWLPILKEMKIGWLVLYSPLTHAIPEDFIRPLAEAGIKLVVDFKQTLKNDPDWQTFEVLLSAYRKWGVTHALLDRNANLRETWGSTRWGNPELIKVYADQFIQFARCSLDNAVHPVLGPLVPGGDYWDSAFMKTLLSKISESASPLLRNNLTLSSYSWTFGRSLDWGAGGPIVWPASKAYQKPDEEHQNQQGFRAYEWVDTAARAVFNRSLPIILLETGIPLSIQDFADSIHESDDQQNIVALAQGRNVYDQENPRHLLSPLPSYIKSVNFFVFSSADPNYKSYCWFTEDGQRLSPAQAYYVREGLIDREIEVQDPQTLSAQDVTHEFLYNRYFLISQDLLLSTPEILDSLHPLMEREKPMLGFSPDEACQAAAITYITNNDDPDPELLQILRSKGSLVNVINPQEISNWIREKYNENA